MAQHNTKTIYLPPPKTCSILRPVKDSLDLKASGVYKIPCKCGAIYISVTGCTIEECTKEPERHLTLTPRMPGGGRTLNLTSRMLGDGRKNN
jgi:hypothetical protein